MTNKEINAAYIGSEQVDKIYLGEDLVYGGEAPEPIYSAMPLTFEVISAGTINFRRINSQSTTPARSVSYSKDGGETWTTFTTATGTTNAIQVQPGDKVQFKGLNNSYASSVGNYNTFFGSATYASTATVKVYGNIMSLVRGDDFTTATTLYGSINSMFRNAGDKLVDASHLILPATTLYLRSYSYMFEGCTSLTTAPALPATALTQQCYSHMFDGCTSLTTAPSLPATTLASSCYSDMFKGCTSLTTTPALPATTLAGNCYNGMFQGCTSLTTAPALPVTTLADGCYEDMFFGCTSLTTAPELPATNLTVYCYDRMFYDCTGLTTAPELPATTLADNCYQSMFAECTNLTTAPELPATTLAQQCYSYMFAGCTSLTTAPELPATTLVASCYERMFQNCTNLNYINCHIVTPNQTHTNYWLNGVAATGTFVKNPDSNWTRSVSGIPSGWTVQDYVDPASIPVLKIAGQSIPGTKEDGYECYVWENLTQYSGTSFTIEVGGLPITADTWNYTESHLDQCGNEVDTTYETGATRSVFEANSGYIDNLTYYTDNNYVDYLSIEDNTSDDPEVICQCQGGCWDGETCQECTPEDPCDDWEGNGYSSYEECTCAERGENCPEEESGE